MTMLDPETVEALNALLEDERASVEIEVALTDGATELYERDIFTQMGCDDIWACCAIRERLDETGAQASKRISGIAPYILSLETYDERLLVFMRHQDAIRERAQELLETVTDGETRRTLEDIRDAHARFVPWCEVRARDFAETRAYAFAGRDSADPPPLPTDGPTTDQPHTSAPAATLTALQDAALAGGNGAQSPKSGSDSSPADDSVSDDTGASEAQ